MILTEQKPFDRLLESLAGYSRVFLVGCGDCATACKTGGREELDAARKLLEAQGKQVLGAVVPESTCVAARLKQALAGHLPVLRQVEAVVVYACGLGVQCFRDNDRLGLKVVPGCDSLCVAVTDAGGVFTQKCSLCGQCGLAETAGMCPVTLCPKGMANGPCGGVDRGKCELDKTRDCVWVLIYRELAGQGKLEQLRQIRPPLDHGKTRKPLRREVIQP